MHHISHYIKQRLLILLVLGFASFTVCADASDGIARLRQQLASSPNDNAKLNIYLKLATEYLVKPGELKKDLDSARYLNNEALKLSRQLQQPGSEARSLLLNARIQLETGQKEEGRKNIFITLAFAKKYRLLNEQGECYETLVDFYDNENAGIEKKLRLLNTAVNLYHRGGNKEKEATALKRIGDYLHVRDRNAESLKVLEKALAIYRSIGFADLQGIYNLLGSVYGSLGNYPLSIKYGLLAAEVAEKLGDRGLQLSSIYNHIGQTYYMLKDDDKAAFYWEKAAKIAAGFNDAAYMQIILTNLATLSIRQHQYEKALTLLARIEKKYPPTDVYMNLRIPYIYFNTYMKMGKFNKLKPYYDKLRMYERTLPADDANQIYLLESIITYLINIKDLKQAYTFLQKEDDLLSKGDNKLMLSRHQYKWFKADSLAGNLNSAIGHYIKYKSLSDAVFNAEKASQINTLQIQFETEQKDRNIKLLTQKNVLQADTIGKDRTIKMFMAGASGLFLLLLISGFFAYRAKQKSNAQLRAKQNEINQQYDILKRLFNEKEWLLKEIHHRVKNNLQIVISLLNTQSAYIVNQDAMDAIQNSQHRMYAMSLIHQKLYQSESRSTIDIKWYIHELIAYMRDCFNIDASIRFVIEADNLALDVAQAVPVGLILNEAITNAIKYAFADGRFGTISISAKQDTDDQCVITIADNGKGLPEGFDVDQLNSLGINLMRGLSEQLEGTFELKNESGLQLDIAFPIKQQFIGDKNDEFIAA